MKTRHHFDTRKGEPSYWLRDDPADIEVHRRMVAAHELVHLGRQRTNGVTDEKHKRLPAIV